jgi:Bacterial RNA polymerase, alpha chain C terminal domain
MGRRRTNRPRQVTVWYRGIPYTLDLLRCRRALVDRQVEGGLDSIESLANAIGASRSTASRFFSGRPTSLAVTLRILEALHLRFEDVAMPSPDDQDANDGSPPPRVGSLGLSVRAANCLVANGITTIDQLVNMTDDELLNLRNLGSETLQEIRDKLAERGFSR